MCDGDGAHHLISLCPVRALLVRGPLLPETSSLPPAERRLGFADGRPSVAVMGDALVSLR